MKKPLEVVLSAPVATPSAATQRRVSSELLTHKILTQIRQLTQGTNSWSIYYTVIVNFLTVQARDEMWRSESGVEHVTVDGQSEPLHPQGSISYPKGLLVNGTPLGIIVLVVLFVHYL